MNVSDLTALLFHSLIHTICLALFELLLCAHRLSRSMAPHDGIPEEDVDALDGSVPLSRISLRKDHAASRHHAADATEEEDPISAHRKRVLFFACICILGMLNTIMYCKEYFSSWLVLCIRRMQSPPAECAKTCLLRKRQPLGDARSGNPKHDCWATNKAHSVQWGHFQTFASHVRSLAVRMQEMSFASGKAAGNAATMQQQRLACLYARYAATIEHSRYRCNIAAKQCVQHVITRRPYRQPFCKVV